MGTSEIQALSDRIVRLEGMIEELLELQRPQTESLESLPTRSDEADVIIPHERLSKRELALLRIAEKNGGFIDSKEWEDINDNWGNDTWGAPLESVSHGRISQLFSEPIRRGLLSVRETKGTGGARVMMLTESGKQMLPETSRLWWESGYRRAIEQSAESELTDTFGNLSSLAESVEFTVEIADITGHSTECMSPRELHGLLQGNPTIGPPSDKESKSWMFIFDEVGEQQVFTSFAQVKWPVARTIRICPSLVGHSPRSVPRVYGQAYSPWSPDDEAKLLTMRNEGMAVAELSIELQRTEGSIRSRLRKIDLNRPRSSEDWTGEEDETLILLNSAGMPDTKIADELDRIIFDIKTRKDELNIGKGPTPTPEIPEEPEEKEDESENKENEEDIGETTPPAASTPTSRVPPGMFDENGKLILPDTSWMNEDYVPGEISPLDIPEHVRKKRQNEHTIGIWKHMGYTVEKEVILGASSRRRNLINIYEAAFVSESPNCDLQYIDSFGEPMSTKRYNVIRRYFRCQTSGNENKPWMKDAVEAWKKDEEWFISHVGYRHDDDQGSEVGSHPEM